jgi:DNA-directed RNA polymerase specialized sigma24 family protein
LLEITLRHCNKWNRRVPRERLFYAEMTDRGNEPADDEPTPDDAAELADLVRWLMLSLATPQERLILSLFLKGYSAPEIGGQVGMSERTTFRTISSIKERVRERLEKLRARD